jgi:hypothetical protein
MLGRSVATSGATARRLARRRQREEREADERHSSPAGEVCSERREEKGGAQWLPELVQRRVDETGVRDHEERFPAGPTAPPPEQRGECSRCGEGEDPGHEESGGGRPGLPRAQDEAEPAQERMAVAVARLVEQVVDVARRNRVDRDAPVELPVVCAGLHGAEARVDAACFVAHGRRRVHARQDGHTPARRPERRHEGDAGDDDCKRAHGERYC